MKHEFSQNIQILYVMKVWTVGAELFHADEQTDMTNLIIAFRNFALAPKKRNESRRAALLCYIYLQAFTTCIFTLRRSVALGRFRLRVSVDAQTTDHSDTSDLAEFHMGFLRRVRNLANSDCWFVDVSVCLRPSYRPPAWNNSASTGRIFMKFGFWGLVENP
jgi:hypothetical protein